LKAFEAYDSLEQLKTASEKTEDEIRRAKASLKELTEQEEALRNKVGELLPKIDADVKQWTNDLTEKLNEVTKSATAALASQNETFKKESDHTIKDINGLKAKLDGDFKTIKENAEAEVKSITELMKSDVNGSKKDFIDAFDQTKQSILDQIKRLIAASQELDKAYKARQEDLPKVQAIVQLIDLISDPRAVTDIRFLGTVHLLLKRSADWIRMNDSRFKFYPTSYDLTTSMNNLDEMLKRLNLEPPAPS